MQIFKRLVCKILRHPHPRFVEEVGCAAEDLTAGTGSILYKGWCDVCKRYVYWSESNV